MRLAPRRDAFAGVVVFSLVFDCKLMLCYTRAKLTDTFVRAFSKKKATEWGSLQFGSDTILKSM